MFFVHSERGRWRNPHHNKGIASPHGRISLHRIEWCTPFHKQTNHADGAM